MQFSDDLFKKLELSAIVKTNDNGWYYAILKNDINSSDKIIEGVLPQHKVFDYPIFNDIKEKMELDDDKTIYTDTIKNIVIYPNDVELVYGEIPEGENWVIMFKIENKLKKSKRGRPKSIKENLNDLYKMINKDNHLSVIDDLKNRITYEEPNVFMSVNYKDENNNNCDLNGIQCKKYSGMLQEILSNIKDFIDQGNVVFVDKETIEEYWITIYVVPLMEILQRFDSFKIPNNIKYVYAKLSDETIKKYKPKEFLNNIKSLEDTQTIALESLINNFKTILFDVVKKSKNEDAIIKIEEILLKIIKKPQLEEDTINEIKKIKNNLNKYSLKEIQQKLSLLA